MTHCDGLIKEIHSIYNSLDLGFLTGNSIKLARSSLGNWSQECDCTFNDLNNAGAVGFAFLAIGCLLVQPTAMKMGRRFIYLLFILFLLISSITGSRINNVRVLYVVKLFGALGGLSILW